jgi:hypothetical protein
LHGKENLHRLTLASAGENSAAFTPITGPVHSSKNILDLF